MSADKAQKSFDATPARKQKAKRDGNIARSSEVSGVAAFACAAAATFIILPFIGRIASDALRAASSHPVLDQLPVGIPLLLGLGMMPVFAAAGGATVANLMQAGGLRASTPRFVLSRLNPIAGIKRMIGGEAIVAAVRALVAFAVVTLALVPLGLEVFARSTTLTGALSFGMLAVDGAQRACWAAAGVGAAFAFADYAFARRRWLRELKMTFEEIRRDQKENDGDPHARSRRKALHRSFARGSIARTKEATFVVVNPTHIAIAIRYAPPTVAVPEIVVRAADDGAQTVKLLARRHGIPIIENVALARALFAHGTAGRAIPSETFVAVARVIAELIRAGVLT